MGTSRLSVKSFVQHLLFKTLRRSKSSISHATCQPKRGEKYLVRPYKELLVEFGTDDNGRTVKTPAIFVDGMKHLCGSIVTVDHTIPHRQINLDGVTAYIFYVEESEYSLDTCCVVGPVFVNYTELEDSVGFITTKADFKVSWGFRDFIMGRHRNTTK